MIEPANYGLSPCDIISAASQPEIGGFLARAEFSNKTFTKAEYFVTGGEVRRKHSAAIHYPFSSCVCVVCTLGIVFGESRCVLLKNTVCSPSET